MNGLTLQRILTWLAHSGNQCIRRTGMRASNLGCSYVLLLLMWVLTNCTSVTLAEKSIEKAASQETLEKTIALLDGDDALERGRAMLSILSLGAKAAPAVPSLIEKLSDERDAMENPGIPWVPSVADRAVEALVAIGKPAVPALGEMSCGAASDDARIRAIRALCDIGSVASQALTHVRKCVHDENEWIRYSAIDALVKIAAQPRTVLPQLVIALDDRSPNVRSIAVRGLGIVGRQAMSAAPRLVAMLTSEDVRIEWYTPDSAGVRPLRLDVVESLGKIGLSDESVLSKVALLLQDSDPQMRIAAALAYCRLSPNIRAGLDVLTAELANNSRMPGNRAEAVRALGQIGRRAKPAYDALVAVIQHGNSTVVRCDALSAVARIRPHQSVDLLMAMYSDEHLLVRETAVGALANGGMKDERVITFFISALDDRDWGVRFHAMQGLGKMGPAARKAIPRLERMVAIGEPCELGEKWDRKGAMVTLKCIRGASPKRRRLER